MSAKLRILVVDDNLEFCQNVADILEMKHYDVAIAYDGFKALDMVRQNDFDLVLMDIKMPEMDGVKTFEKIREMTRDTPVIMMSAYAVDDLLREALRQEAFGILKKPFEFERLDELINRAIPNGGLILVVDDEQGFCANIKDVLSDKGYRVDIAYDGKMAIEKAWENNFDIIILDMKLPSFNGLETYLCIREVRQNAVVIVVTGYPKEMGDLAEKAVQASAYARLEKPINMDELIALLVHIEGQKAKGLLQKP